MSLPPPAAKSRSLDLARALGFVAEDPDWLRKILIGGVAFLACFLLIPIPLFAGYQYRMVQRVANDERPAMPEWEDLGGLFADGLRAVGFMLVHLLLLLAPAFLLGILGIVLAAGVAALGGGGAADVGGMLAGLLVAGAYGLVMLGSLALWLYVPAAFLRFCLSGGDFATGFDFRANFQLIRRNVGNYLLGLLLYFVAQFIGQLGVILCCVGVLPGIFWSYCVLSFVLGEVARLDAGGGDATGPMPGGLSLGKR